MIQLSIQWGWNGMAVCWQEVLFAEHVQKSVMVL